MRALRLNKPQPIENAPLQFEEVLIPEPGEGQLLVRVYASGVCHTDLHTVEGDIHDLGKNIVSVLLGCHRFAVQDLGVDVSPSAFCEQAARFLPHVVGLSGLVASAYEAMRETVVLLRNQGYAGPIVIGGGQLSETVCQYVGADYWTTDAVDGVELCTRLIAEAE